MTVYRNNQINHYIQYKLTIPSIDNEGQCKKALTSGASRWTQYAAKDPLGYPGSQSIFSVAKSNLSCAHLAKLKIPSRVQ